jgi:hypothetical protein
LIIPYHRHHHRRPFTEEVVIMLMTRPSYIVTALLLNTPPPPPNQDLVQRHLHQDQSDVYYPIFHGTSCQIISHMHDVCPYQYSYY